MRKTEVEVRTKVQVEMEVGVEWKGRWRPEGGWIWW